MSSRQLRKLQQQRELEQARSQAQQEEIEEEEEEEDEEPFLAPTSNPSLFANLAALEDEEEDSDPEVEEKQAVEKETSIPVPTTSAKKPKKSKKNKKKKAAKAKDESASKPEAADDFDDIDAALKELSLKQSSGGAKTNEPVIKIDPEYQRVCALLGINSQHLKVGNEMRNLFGKGITDVVGGDEPQGGRGGRRRQQNEQLDLEAALKGRHLKGKGLAELTLRRNAFIQGKDDWPKSTTGGLSMAIVNDDTAEDGTMEFKYLYDNEYTAAQLQFRQAVEMGDPQQMIGLLQRHRKCSSKLQGLLLIILSLQRLAIAYCEQDRKEPRRSCSCCGSTRKSSFHLRSSCYNFIQYKTGTRKGEIRLRQTGKQRVVASWMALHQGPVDEGNVSDSSGMGQISLGFRS